MPFSVIGRTVRYSEKGRRSVPALRYAVGCASERFTGCLRTDYGRRLAQARQIFPTATKSWRAALLDVAEWKALSLWQPRCKQVAVLIGDKALLLARYMDLLTSRQRLVATNIANADTPGYRARDIDFGREMARALDQPRADPLPPIALYEVEGLRVKNDGNNVNLHRELQALADTGMRFNLAAQMLRGNIQSVRTAIREGR